MQIYHKKIQEQAALWFARMQNAETDHPERSSFEAWLTSSHQHAAAYNKLVSTWGRLDTTIGIKEVATAIENAQQLTSKNKNKLQRRVAQVVLSVALFAVSSLLGLEIWKTYVPETQLASKTEIGQIKKEVLADGSEITINANTQLTVRYYAGRRVAHISHGEAIFNVTKDAKRPFIVECEPAKITVLGTRFVVNKLSKMVRVSVDHGRVQVEAAAHHAQPPLILTNGQVAEVLLNQAPLQVKRNSQDAFGFENGTIAFEEADLSEIAEVLSRYTPQPISVAPSQKNPKITALVHIKNMDGFLRMLPSIAAVDVKKNKNQMELVAR